MGTWSRIRQVLNQAISITIRPTMNSVFGQGVLQPSKVTSTSVFPVCPAVLDIVTSGSLCTLMI